MLRSNWRLEALKFPARFQLVLLHNVDRSERTIKTFHTALLFRQRNGFTYLEKAGTRGPFVRLDLVHRAAAPT